MPDPTSSSRLVTAVLATVSFLVGYRSGALAAEGAEGFWEIPAALLVTTSVTVTLYTAGDLLRRRRTRSADRTPR